jgi:hypothetical protein
LAQINRVKERGRKKKEKKGICSNAEREEDTGLRQRIMLNVQGFWTGHVSSRETSRGQGAVAYLISRRVPVTGRRGLVGTVNRVDGEVPGTCNCTVVATRLAVEQAMVAPGMLLAQKCCCLSGLKRGVLWRKRGVLALLGRKCAPPPHGSERWKLLGC